MNRSIEVLKQKVLQKSVFINSDQYPAFQAESAVEHLRSAVSRIGKLNGNKVIFERDVHDVETLQPHRQQFTINYGDSGEVQYLRNVFKVVERALINNGTIRIPDFLDYLTSLD